MSKVERIVLVMELRDSIEITTGSAIASTVMFMFFCKD